MQESLLMIEPLARLGSFAGILLLLLLAESLFPRRGRAVDRLVRWPANLGTGLLNTFVVRLLLPASAVGFAALVAESGFGLLNRNTLPPATSMLLAFVALDLIIYAQHRVFHSVPALWRLHRMHHTDADVDVTTALRFHPFEIALSMLIKIAAIALLGAPAAAVLAFEIVLNGSAMFNHSNINLPQWLDKTLRMFIVTPDMHRIHHSTLPTEHNSNFGFNLSLWDRLFSTYIDKPEKGQLDMQTGLPGYSAIEAARIDRMLANPFERERR